jgi:hypothetical protein
MYKQNNDTMIDKVKEEFQNEGRKDQTEMASFVEDLKNAIDKNVFQVSGVDGEDYETFSITIKDNLANHELKQSVFWIDQVDMHLMIDELGDLFMTVYVDGFTYHEDKKIGKDSIKSNYRLLNLFKGFAELHYMFHFKLESE